MTQTPAPKAPQPSRKSLYLCLGLAALVAIGIIADTKIVPIGSEADLRQQAFSPDGFGLQEFPRIQSLITEKAVEGSSIAAEVLADKVAAGAKYGTASSTGAILMVRLTGTMGEAKAGIYDLKADAMPTEIRVRVQTGPAINGTDLRDAPGDIAFGSFKNQIEYQDVGAALNRAMKQAVLDPVDTATLSGKTVEIVGAFRLINPKNWLLTPVSVRVK